MDTKTSIEGTAAKLGALPALSGLQPEGLTALAKIVKAERYKKGERISGPDDSHACMYLLVSGRVKMCLTAGDSREVALYHVEAPAHFNEPALVRSPLRTADAVALTDVEVLSLSAEKLGEAIQMEPNLALSIISALSLRLRQTVSRLEDMVFLNATQRVMRIVFNAASTEAESTGNPVIEGMTHYDIATLAGTSRETASRVISSLARQEVISTQGRRIDVDLQTLSGMIQQSQM
ncbi:MAG: Crp/Fnr family transcriptional regulator [Coriobacteriia bacterium]|nr:Crp/Fnr family transcriptional regulator [Coriobacteriia bacterium]